MKPYIEVIAKYHNQASDTHFVWFPFLFLKPPPEREITIPKTIIMAICFASYFNFAFQIKEFLASQAITWQSLGISQIQFTIGFLIWFNIATRPLWNYRAYHLQQTK